MELRTLNDVFFTVVGRDHDRAMPYRQDGVWTPVSSAQLHRWVTAVARQLQEWGIRQGDRVLLLSENRPEWAVVDYATLLLGAVVVPVYATQTPEQVLYVLRHSDARVAFVSSRKQYDKIEAVRQESKLERVVVMDKVDDLPEVPQMQYLLSGADDLEDSAIEAFAHTIQTDDVATLIYTSGTTGTPKGVILPHGNIASNLNMSVQMTEIGMDDLAVSFLPLSHITARHVDYLLACRGVTAAHCPVFEYLPRRIQEVGPPAVLGAQR